MRYVLVARWPDGFEALVCDRGITFTKTEANAKLKALKLALKNDPSWSRSSMQRAKFSVRRVRDAWAGIPTSK